MKKTHLPYTKIWICSPGLALCRAIYRAQKDPEDETGPRVENRRVDPQDCRGSARIAADPRNTRDSGPWFWSVALSGFETLRGISSFE